MLKESSFFLRYLTQSCLFVVVVYYLASSEELFPDCLKVKYFTSLPLFAAFV